MPKILRRRSGRRFSTTTRRPTERPTGSGPVRAMANSRTRQLLAAALIVFAVSPGVATPQPAAKKKITRAAEVPQLYFRGPRNSDALAATPEAFAPLAAAVRAHVEAVLRDYDIQDKTTLKNLHTTLAHLA